MARYKCTVCGYVYDEEAEGARWADLPPDWVCPVCGADTGYFEGGAEPSGAGAGGTPAVAATQAEPAVGLEGYLSQWRRTADDVESHLETIQHMAVTGESVVEPMRTRMPVISWDEILVKGAQIARVPRTADEPVNTSTVIGPGAALPLRIDTPVYVTHMSFGALSREAKIALARGSAAVGTATCSGEGGILPEELEAAHRYIFEYVPNRYSVTDDNLRRADAIEIKLGQSAKPGMGGHLPGDKVTAEIAAIRGFPEGEDIISPARFDDIATAEDLRTKVIWLRERSGGRPIGVKLAAGHIEADLEVVLHAEPDFITVDGRAGATGAAVKVVKDSTSVPTIYALHRARTFLDARGAAQVSLIITGGLRSASDFAKALALGADAIAVGTAALIAIGCQQYKVCHSGRCPVGITTQDPELRSRLDVELSAQRLELFFRVATEELQEFARLTGHDDVHGLGLQDLCTTSSEISDNTAIPHAGRPEAPAG